MVEKFKNGQQDEVCRQTFLSRLEDNWAEQRIKEGIHMREILDDPRMAVFSHLREVTRAMKTREAQKRGVHMNIEEEINNMVLAFARLVIELEGRLMQYHTLMGEGAGSLLPLRFLSRVIRNKREEMGEQDNLRKCLIIGGGVTEERSALWSWREKFQDMLHQQKSSLGSVLVVTEYIEGGRHILPIAEDLQQKGINFDIATLAIADSYVHADSVRGGAPIYHNAVLSNKIAYGMSGSVTTGGTIEFINTFFHRGSDLAGVRSVRDSAGRIHPTKGIERSLHVHQHQEATQAMYFLAEKLSQLI